MSLEAYRSRMRELERAARSLATSAECSGPREPELIQITVYWHPPEGTAPARRPSSLDLAPGLRGKVRMNWMIELLVIEN